MEQVTIQKRKLPHIYVPLQTYFVTYRLKGTYIDKYKSDRLQSYLEMDEKYDMQKQTINFLMEAQPAEIVMNSLKYYDKSEYKLLCFCVMPNHVHVVFSLLEETR